MADRFGDCLYTATQHEKAGRLSDAIGVLKLARRYTHDHDELVQLGLWQNRLEREMAAEGVKDAQQG